MNILYVNGDLPADTLNTLRFEKIVIIYLELGVMLGLLNRPNVNTTNFGLHSFTRLYSNQWNELQNSASEFQFFELKLNKLKSLSTEFDLKKYP